MGGFDLAVKFQRKKLSLVYNCTTSAYCTSCISSPYWAKKRVECRNDAHVRSMLTKTEAWTNGSGRHNGQNCSRGPRRTPQCEGKTQPWEGRPAESGHGPTGIPGIGLANRTSCYRQKSPSSWRHNEEWVLLCPSVLTCGSRKLSQESVMKLPQINLHSRRVFFFF